MSKDKNGKKKKGLSRRDFLRVGGLSAVGAIAAACGANPGAQEATAPAATAAAEVTGAAPEQEVTLEVVTNLAEYENAHRQALDLFTFENPGVTINLSTFNEDTEAAYLAKVAGGFLPAMEAIPSNSGRRVDTTNYQEWVNLGEIDFPWWDRWTYDVRNTWSERFDLPGPRTLDPYQGIVVSFIYHVDMMEDLGWNPQTDVKTLDDFARMMEDVDAFVEDSPDVDFGWDRGWINGFMYLRYMNLVPVAYEDGSRERQQDCWMGRAAFNAPDSPYRHTFEFSREAMEKGWNHDGWWNREWEADQESTFGSKRSIMLLHGPWLWDKAMAANPELQLAGIPFPSVDGEDTVLHMEEPAIDWNLAIRAGNEETEYWDTTQKLFAWWHSPEIVKARAEIVGRNVLYELEEPLELDAPQWTGLLQHVGEDFFSHVRIDDGPWGMGSATPYQIAGSPGPWDLGGGSYNETFVAAITGEISVQEALDVAQANWDRSYEGLPPS